MSATSEAEAFTQRPPQQKRSRESYDRMLKAAEKLLIERGGGDFTLTEISKLGKVSIGSIYCRFSSKEDLIYAVQADFIQRLEADERIGIRKAKENSGNLSELVVNLVSNIADTLRKHAPLLRAFMHLATLDPKVQQTGRGAYLNIEREMLDLLLSRKNEIMRKDPERAAVSTFKIMYSVIARQLGFGAAVAPASRAEWSMLKEDLAKMCSLYLTSKD